MGYKKDDRCLDKAEDDEPIFVLLARDPIAAMVVEYWASLSRDRNIHADKRHEANRHADRMRAWRKQNR